MEKSIVIDYGYENLKLDKGYDKVLIITDENVYESQFEKFIKNLKHKYIELFIIKSGEESKSLKVYEELIKFCIKTNITRKSLVIALGGGVVGDLAGFVASTYMRGIELIQVPTTLLSQVDSSVGGKTGINLGNIKNIMGTFYQPKLTYINVNSLNTLSEEDYISGLGEVLKYCFIYDYEFLKYIKCNYENILNRDENTLHYIIKKCTDIKWDVVNKDEKESGLRKILNLGHTFGHGIEKLCNLSHGKSVNIGTNLAFELAIEKELIDYNYYEEFKEVSNLLNLPTKCSVKDCEEILYIMKSDKKNSFGFINLVLPIGKGKVEIFNNINDNDILNVMRRCLNA